MPAHTPRPTLPQTAPLQHALFPARLLAHLLAATALMAPAAHAGATTPGDNSATPAAPTALYRYTDDTGRTVYSNRPPPPGTHARRLTYVPSPPRRPLPPTPPQVVPASPSALARPQAPEAPGRSQQQTVVEELARQVEALQMARNALKEGEAVRNGDERNYQRYLDRIQGLRDTVTRNEGIVEALQGQLRLLGGGGLVE